MTICKHVTTLDSLVRLDKIPFLRKIILYISWRNEHPISFIEYIVLCSKKIWTLKEKVQHVTYVTLSFASTRHSCMGILTTQLDPMFPPSFIPSDTNILYSGEYPATNLPHTNTSPFILWSSHHSRMLQMVALRKSWQPSISAPSKSSRVTSIVAIDMIQGAKMACFLPLNRILYARQQRVTILRGISVRC